MRYDPTPDEAQAAFELLELELAKHPLPTEAGPLRVAVADEFMCMSRDQHGRYWFKHRDTRNYVCLDPAGPALIVPQTKAPFMGGTFDLPVVAHCGQAMAAIFDADGSLQRAGLLIVDK